MANMRSGRGKMLLIAALCIAPVVASYLAYYVWQPQGRVNYGDLLALRQLPDAEGFAGSEIGQIRGKASGKLEPLAIRHKFTERHEMNLVITADTRPIGADNQG